jgi:hypothetical protein
VPDRGSRLGALRLAEHLAIADSRARWSERAANAGAAVIWPVRQVIEAIRPVAMRAGDTPEAARALSAGAGPQQDAADQREGVRQPGRAREGHRPGRRPAAEPARVDGVLGVVRRAGAQDLQFLPAVVVGE